MATLDPALDPSANKCPHCFAQVPEESIWIYQMRFYCSEGCCREVQKNRGA